MTDKFRRTFPLKITFSQGERPSNQKLTAVSEQSRNAMALIEQAVGDIWNQSGDTVLTSYPLLIPTIARMIGQNKYLNPVIYPMDGDFEFTESIGEKYIGRNEFHLTYKPKDGTAASITCTGTSISGSPQTNERDVDASGEYWVDNNTGRFRSYVALSGNETITYTVDTTEWIIGEETLPGVIPDPRQADFTSCRIEESGAKFYVHLPPRLPLTLDSDRERPASYPSSLSSEITANSASDVSSPQKFWQQSTINALTGAGSAHYRYALPTELQAAFAGGDIAQGEEIPKGFLYLYDADNDVLLEDVVFKRPLTGDTGYTLEVSSDTFDFSTVTGSDDESETTYNASGLILVTCGSPLSRILWSLMSTLFKHKHEKGQTLDATVSHSDLDDTNPPSADYAIGDGHNTRYPTHLPSWFPSNWSYDVHTSLLSRAGAQTDFAKERDKFNNAMLGHLILANADTSGSENYLDSSCPNDSFKLYFGDIDGSYVFASSGHICIMPSSSKAVGIGTDSPEQPLHIYHATDNFVLGVESGDSGSYIGFKDSLSGAWDVAVGCIESEMALYSGGVETVRIDDNGCVGIGTTDPEILGSGTISGSIFTLYNNSGYAQANIRSSNMAVLNLEDTGAGSNTKIIQLKTDDGYTSFGSLNDDLSANQSSILTINHSTGYIGINKIASSYPLEVNGTIEGDRLKITNTGTDIIAEITAASSGYDASLYLFCGNDDWALNHDDSDANKLHLKYNGSTKVTFTTDGKVGIGDSTPSYPLEVIGTSRFMSTVFIGDGTGSGWMTINSSSGNDATIRLDCGSAEWDIKNKGNTSNQLQFRFENAIKFYVSTDGTTDTSTLRADDYYWKAAGSQTRYVYIDPSGAQLNANGGSYNFGTYIVILPGEAIHIPISVPQYSELEQLLVEIDNGGSGTGNTTVSLLEKDWDSTSSSEIDSFSWGGITGSYTITLPYPSGTLDHTVVDGKTYWIKIYNGRTASVDFIGAKLTITETRVPVYNYTI